MAKMRRFDNGGSVSEKPQGATRYDDRGRVIPLYEEDSGIVAQRASQAAPSYSTKLGNVDTSDSRNMQETIAKLKGIVGLPGGEQYGNITMPEIVKSMYQKSQSPTTPTPADHFTNLPSGSAAQVNAMRNVVGLPATDEAANKEKAQNMLRSIVGLTPNTSNYSLQDAISQLKGQYTAPGGMQGMGAMGNESMPGTVARVMGAPAPAIKGGQGMGLAGMQAPTAPPPEVPAPQDQMMAEGQGGFKRGGKIKAFSKGGSTGRDGIAQRGKTKAFAKGGSVSASSRGDGCAQRGKTRGMMR